MTELDRRNLYERLCLTALGQSYFDGALTEARAIKELTVSERAVLGRYLDGVHTSLDHVRLQKIAIRILEEKL